jgi:hypothetical protein
VNEIDNEEFRANDDSTHVTKPYDPKGKEEIDETEARKLYDNIVQHLKGKPE